MKTFMWIFALLFVTLPSFAAQVSGVVKQMGEDGKPERVINASITVYTADAKQNCLDPSKAYDVDSIPYSCLHKYFVADTLSTVTGNFYFPYLTAREYYVLAVCSEKTSCSGESGLLWSDLITVKEPTTTIKINFGYFD